MRSLATRLLPCCRFLEPVSEQPQRVDRNQRRRFGVSENGGLEAGDTQRRDHQEHGLEAQRVAVARHVLAIRGELVEEFTEIERRRWSDRPRLAVALAECRARQAVLVIARLDRLVRDAHFLLGLAKAGTRFVGQCRIGSKL